jgi:ureidoacrylate peracid hydrolase
MATAQEQSSLEAKWDRQSSALLIVDMQNDFCHPAGAQGKRGRDLSMVYGMIPKFAEVLKGARQIGLPVIFVRTLHYIWTDSKTWRKRLEGYKQGIEICLPGSWGAEIIDALAPLESEPVVVKHRYSAFVDTDLALVLRSMKIHTLLIGGVGTNVCVESTARHAYMLDYDVCLLEDCTAGCDLELHRGTLRNIAEHFGKVARGLDILPEFSPRGW